MATVLTIGGHNQSAAMRFGSLSVKFNTLDVVLTDPSPVPANGDAVTLTNPTWPIVGTANVVSVGKSDPVDRAGHVFVTITATTPGVATASAAPWNLSDVPNGSTTYGYRSLQSETTKNTDGTTTTHGSCIVEHTGLWPAMTFTLTSANQGFSATNFSVTNVTVTWPANATAPEYYIEFGDPIVTMAVWANQDPATGLIDGTRITLGSVDTPQLNANVVVANVANVGGTVTIDSTGITLADANGKSTLTSDGFAGAWADYTADGLYDSALGSVTAGAVSNGLTADLPNWTVSRTNLTLLVAHADATWPGGFYIEAVPSALNGQAMFVSDLVAVTPLSTLMPQATIAASYAAGTLEFDIVVTFYAGDGSTVVSSVGGNVALLAASQTTPIVARMGPVAVPDAARFTTLTFTMKETVSHNAGNQLRFGGAALRPVPFAGMLPYRFVADASVWLPWANTTSIPSNQTNVYPIYLPTPLYLVNCNLVNADASLSRSFQWGLYVDPWGGAIPSLSSGNPDLATLVPGATGSAAWTATGRAIQGGPPAIVPIVVPPGSYWLAIHNNHSTNALTLAATQNVLANGPTSLLWGIAGAGALGATLDSGAATLVGTTVPAVWLQGVSLGTNWG